MGSLQTTRPGRRRGLAFVFGILAYACVGAPAHAITPDLADRGLHSRTVLPPEPCETDEDCSGAGWGPACDPESGTCHRCREGDACVDATHRCDPDTGQCVRPCSNDEECDQPTPRCHPEEQYCVVCQQDIDCQDPGMPRCSAQVGRCMECRADDDCTSPDRPWCEDMTCAQCRDSDDCPEPQYCSGTACVDDECIPGESTCRQCQINICRDDGSGLDFYPYGSIGCTPTEDPDGCWVDGLNPEPSAGATSDADREPGVDGPPPGCGCSTRPPTTAWGLFLTAFVIIRRRRKHTER